MNILEKSIRAIGGVFNERLLAYFKNYGATSNVLQDAEKEYLRGKGLTFGANQDAWKQLDSKYEDIIPLEVSDILKKYNATMLLPGVSGAMRFGYQPGNYRESTGQTLAAADQQVGLVVDAARVPGPERVTNGDFSNGTTGWTNNGGIATTFESVVHEGVRCLRVVTPAINGGASQSALISGGRNAVSYRLKVVSGSIYLGISGNEIGGVRNTTNSGSWTTVTHPAYGATNAVLRVYALSAAEFYVTDISVRELPGIHASQSTSGFRPVLRNTAGIQSWQFDGTDDRLSLSAVPFQMSDDPFCIVAFECGALGANRSVIDLATSASSARFANLRINAIGQPQSVVVNDALSSTLITAKEVSAGTKLVLAATTAEGVQKLYVDGAYAAEAVLSGTFTPTESYIGSRKGTSENFNGPIHCVIFGKGAISGAELLTLERFVASLQGRTL